MQVGRAALAGGVSLVPAGLRYMALGAFWFSLMALGVKIAGRRIPSQEIVLVRAVITLVLSYAMVRRAGVPLWGTKRGLLLLRGALGFAALSFFYYSLVHLPLAEATLIQHTNPLFTALLAAGVLGERLGRREIGCIAVSLAGVVLVARPAALFGGSSQLSPQAVAIALAGALCSAGAYVTIRRLLSEHPLVIVFYFPLVTVPATLPLVTEPVWPTGFEWMVLLGVGVATQIAQVYMTRGLQMEPPPPATAVGYLQIVFATAWGALLFHERPGPWSIAGGLLILGSTLVLVQRRAETPVPADGSAGPSLSVRSPSPR